MFPVAHWVKLCEERILMRELGRVARRGARRSTEDQEARARGVEALVEGPTAPAAREGQGSVRPKGELAGH